MKKIIKNFSYVICCLAIASSVSGCSLKKTTTTTTPKVFTIWSFEDEDVWKLTIKQIQKDMGGYEIKYVKKTFSDTYEDNSLNSILSGQGPDIWAIPNDWVYRHKDKLAPMPDDLVKSSKINLDTQYVPAVKESGYFDGKIYSLPATVDSLMLFYNPKIFSDTITNFNNSHKGLEFADARKDTNTVLSSAPVTWENFTKAVSLITQKNGNNITLSGAALGTSNNIYESQDILYALMLQNKTKMISDDLQTSTLNLPTDSGDYPAQKALDFYTSFSDQNSPNYSWNKDMPDNIQAFAEGKVGMMLAYDSMSNYINQLYPNLKYSKAPLPQIGISDENIVDYASYYTFVVPKASANSSSAWSSLYNMSNSDSSSFSTSTKLPSGFIKSSYTPSLTTRASVGTPGKIQSYTAQVWNKGRYPTEVDNKINELITCRSQTLQSSMDCLNATATSVTSILRREGW